jgi:hypothetical protein
MASGNPALSGNSQGLQQSCNAMERQESNREALQAQGGGNALGQVGSAPEQARSAEAAGATEAHAGMQRDAAADRDDSAAQQEAGCGKLPGSCEAAADAAAAPPSDEAHSMAGDADDAPGARVPLPSTCGAAADAPPPPSLPLPLPLPGGKPAGVFIDLTGTDSEDDQPQQPLPGAAAAAQHPAGRVAAQDISAEAGRQPHLPTSRHAQSSAAADRPQRLHVDLSCSGEPRVAQAGAGGMTAHVAAHACVCADKAAGQQQGKKRRSSLCSPPRPEAAPGDAAQQAPDQASMPQPDQAPVAKRARRRRLKAVPEPQAPQLEEPEALPCLAVPAHAVPGLAPAAAAAHATLQAAPVPFLMPR